MRLDVQRNEHQPPADLLRPRSSQDKRAALSVHLCDIRYAVLVVVAIRAWDALGRIAAAFWTMALTLFTLLAFVVAAGLFSRGFQWVVASMPDKLGVGAL